ncbi:uncharacterized protein LOC116032575 isoform X1 [Ipomoea triloba]|uniref:uncharacterized protein LOC116032575 isoform X1 n=2 Tax=Ipomoea triloba TaxID=35885 RepID=UPI00125D4144|nr:uncharacterized protein LOC116032575 isoform X1 [Ipomoea triloba]
MEEHYIEDCKALLSQTKQQEKDLRLKRRWLMGVNLSRWEQDCMESLKPPNDKFVPESVLREDDLSYENIRTFVEKTLGVHNAERNHHVTEDDEIQLFDSPKNLKYITSLLDEMTNKGLFCFAEIVTNGSVNFLKTKKKMRKIIKEFLPKLLECRDDHSQMKLKQLARLLVDPQNFCQNEMALSNPSQSFRAACIDVIARLEELPFVALSAMYRNLRGVKGYTLKLQGRRSGWSLERLVKQIRRKSMEMLQEFCDGDEPPEPLAKALAVAYLMLKPKPRTLLPNVSPDIEVLQSDILKAIELVKDKRKISYLELKKLQIMLDPGTEPSEQNCRVRVTMKNLLTEYLLECINMDCIPKSLLETVRIINRTSQGSAPKTFSTEEIQEEINCLLHLSAQAKQIVLDSLPENEFDKDFADAYMEDVEECDESGYDSHDNICSFNPDDLDCQSESVGEISPVDSKSPVSSSRAENLTPLFSPNKKLSVKLESMNITEKNSLESRAFLHSSKNFDDTSSIDENGDQAGSTGQQRKSCSHINKYGFSTISSANGLSGRSNDGLKEPKTEFGYKPTFASSNFLQADTTVVNDNKSNFENQYLIIQEACDETSMFAYSFVDQVLSELARLDRLEMPKDHMSNLQADALGLKNSKGPTRRHTFGEDGVGSVMVNVLEVLMPSFPSREKEELKVLMGI